jgi:DNA helicase IV
MESHKQQLLEKLKKHIEYIRGKITNELLSVKVFADRSLKEIKSMRPDDQALYMDLKQRAMGRVEELNHLFSSPYFMKCEISDSETDKVEEYFFSKHQLSEEKVYSWVSPVASIRFENPGKVSYILPSGETKEVFLHTKEQYMIVDGKVVFFALEKENTPRELIYQEHFTVKKSGFVLPEIVAQMEKAQDQVIRAHHKGSLVISGPAGSGKTTLALHRVAYLTQAPDSAALFPAESIIVFVQDNGTKKYFSHLLPGLGIHNVTITTFSEWAFKVLHIKGYEYVTRYGDTEEEKDRHEYQKIRALRENKIRVEGKDHFEIISEFYKDYIVNEGSKTFERQRRERKLDRFDLTILLQMHIAEYGSFETRREYMTYVGDTIKKKTKKTPVAYSLMVIDEFQNYLPEQLSILKHPLDKNTQAVIYVGDMAQQVQLGTLKKWEDIQEDISPDRNIRLDKVYRNTKHILEFIRNLGYSVSIPAGIKEGPKVTEKILLSQQEEIDYVLFSMGSYEKGSIGILSKDATYLEPFKKVFTENKHVHVLTMSESQGVEFDIVFIVGINDDTFSVVPYTDVSLDHIQERKRIQKDLLYVALTRAISELHILGKNKLSEVGNLE